MKYTKEAHNTIYKAVFGVNPQYSTGLSALGSYRSMVKNIELNYNPNKLEEMMKKLNEMIMPYYEDIKTNPNKIL